MEAEIQSLRSSPWGGDPKEARRGPRVRATEQPLGRQRRELCREAPPPGR